MNSGNNPDEFDVYTTLLQQVTEVHQTLIQGVKDELEQLRISDLTPIQALLIFNIGDKEITPSQLKSRGYYRGTNVTHSLDKLAELQYISRVRSLEDQRKVYIRLTNKGHEVRRAIITRLRSRAKRLFQSHTVTQTMVEELNKELRKVAQRLSGRNHYV